MSIYRILRVEIPSVEVVDFLSKLCNDIQNLVILETEHETYEIQYKLNLQATEEYTITNIFIRCRINDILQYSIGNLAIYTNVIFIFEYQSNASWTGQLEAIAAIINHLFYNTAYNLVFSFEYEFVYLIRLNNQLFLNYNTNYSEMLMENINYFKFLREKHTLMDMNPFKLY